MAVGQAKSMLAGQAGRGGKVGVSRGGKTDTEEVDVVRTKMPEPKLQVQKVDNDTIAIRFSTLDAGRKDELRTKLLEAEKQGMSKVILDVRDCGRGQTSGAIEVARLFVTSGTLTKLHGQTITEQIFSAEPSKVVWKGPLSVLMDGTTTGAAEVLAAAIA